MGIYRPTYLYIKQHNKTGLLYLGKTCKLPYIYCGSGKRWLNHIMKHGKEHVETIWVSELFIDPKLLKESALRISNYFDVVNSASWANLIPETGINGGGLGPGFGKNNHRFGKPVSQEIRMKHRKAILGKKYGPASQERKDKNTLLASKEWKIYYENGNIEIVKNLKQWCKNNNYPYKKFLLIGNGKDIIYENIIKITKL